MQLVERAAQLHALESALSEVQGGEGCFVLVYGEAGIGKTSLVERFTKEKEQSWRILSGACDLLFTPRPLGPLGDIARQTGGRLLKLLDAGADRGLLFPACLNELQSRPTILIIEDIHWADEATLDLLKYLGRRMRQTTCLMILTYRDDEVGDGSALQLVLGDLSSSHCIHRVPVSALSVVGVRELMKDRNVDPVALHRLTSGNPFFLAEVLAGDGSMPQSVRDAMLARAARLSPPARATLEAASVAGLHIEAWLLTEMSGADAMGVEECVAKGMLQEQGNGYAFRHELARQAILARVPVNRKREMNRRALAALKASPQTCKDLARLASHAEGTWDAEAVLEYAPVAARQAATAGAHRQAAALYGLALRFAGALPVAEHAQMMEAYAEELRFPGPKEPVIPVRRKIVELYHARGDCLGEGLNLAILACELQEAGRKVESEEAIQRAITMLEALPPSTALARAYGAQCFLLGVQLEYEKSVAAGEKAIALAERFEEADIVARAGNLAGQVLLLMGDERGQVLLERSLTVAREYALHYAVGMVLYNWAAALVVTFQFAEACRVLQEGIAYTARHEDDYHGAGMPILQAQIKLYQGQWAEAVGLIQRTVQQPEMKRILPPDALWLLGRLGVRRGDTDATDALDEALTTYVQSNTLESVGTLRAGLAEEAWLRGHHPRAIEEARAAYDLMVSSHVPWVAGELAFWRWRAGEVFTPPEWIAKPYALQIAGDWRGAALEWEIRGCPYSRGWR